LTVACAIPVDIAALIYDVEAEGAGTHQVEQQQIAPLLFIRPDPDRLGCADTSAPERSGEAGGPPFLGTGPPAKPAVPIDSGAPFEHRSVARAGRQIVLDRHRRRYA